jgi:transcriptional regulator with XRE-family HTH domain
MRLRALRATAKVPGRVVAAAAEIDSALLSKIENGRKLPTSAQLAALATFFKVPAGPLESQRMAEEIIHRYGQREELAAAAAIIREAAGEYRVQNVSITADKSGQPVNKQKETGKTRFSRRNAAQSDAQ